jgi:hypothetical protein
VGLPDPTMLPPTDSIIRLRSAAAELAALDDELGRLEERAQTVRDRRNALARRELPDLFARCMTDSIGLPEQGPGVRVEVHTEVHASIPADWTQERREEALVELERLGGGTLIGTELTVFFGRGELDLARQLQDHIRGLNWVGDRPIRAHQTVHWATLTKFVSELLGRDVRPSFSLERLGATLIPTARILRAGGKRKRR